MSTLRAIFYRADGANWNSLSENDKTSATAQTPVEPRKWRRLQ